MEFLNDKLYSVLTKKEVREKISEAIDDISEWFALSKSDATVILIRLKWNSFEAKARLSGDKKRLMEESGLVHQKGWVTFCGHQDHFDDDGKVSTPYCSHRFCKICWRDYLIQFMEKNNKKKEKEEETVMFLCPKPNCIVPIGPDTIKEIKEPEVKTMYENYLLESFMEGNKKTVKWCPQSGCNYAVSLCEDIGADECNAITVMCLCGYMFCWECLLESHRPVTCEEADLWLNHHLELAKWIAFSISSRKRCPKCNTVPQRVRDPALSLTTCTCSHRFCWRCLRSEEQHKGITHCIEVFDQRSTKYGKRRGFSVETSPDTLSLTHYLTLWDERQKELEKDQSEAEYFEVMKCVTKNFGYNEQDVVAVREAFLMVIQCRLVQKWSIVYDSFLPENRYMTRLRGEANETLNRHIKTFKELVHQAVLSDDFSCFKLVLSASTANTGKFFHDFVEDLENGLTEVKDDDDDDDDAYGDNAPKSFWFWFWFCDGCTFRNTRFDKQCKMCFAPMDSFVPPPLGSNIASSSKASARRQQVTSERENHE